MKEKKHYWIVFEKNPFRLVAIFFTAETLNSFLRVNEKLYQNGKIDFEMDGSLRGQEDILTDKINY